jgi:hypothetical protein
LLEATIQYSGLHHPKPKITRIGLGTAKVVAFSSLSLSEVIGG